MTRIFLPPEHLESNEIVITGDNARHLALVLRIKTGETVHVLDGNGSTYTCKVLDVQKKNIVVQKVDKKACAAESPLSITLVQGIPRREKMELIIQKSTELGVHIIMPVITERSQVRHTQKLDRWKKIAASAAQQSGRERIPEIMVPVTFDDYLAALPDLPLDKTGKQDGLLKVILSETCEEQNLKKILKANQDATQISLLVGPEGGFSREEIHVAVEKAFVEVSLGPRILRTETAPISSISIIQYELGDMG
ncbi:MAG: 16S rRNA (uracil(1498)-N(3))-methyltransferase [Nitrospiraceae bacterium]|nr:MAG: 16S rRNA (uracil(1498)-N(3))-methyltransferase [Nitrospiraceae bacterium]